MSQANAAQLRFEHKSQMYHYVWRSADNKTHQIRFTLQQYPRDLTYFSAYSPNRANLYIAEGLKKFAAKQDPTKARIEILNQGQTLKWKIQSDTLKHTAELEQAIHKIQQSRWRQYLHKYRFRIIQSPSGQEGIIPDHPRIALQSAPFLKNLAMQFFPAKSPLSKLPSELGLLLSFIQSIPYQELQSKTGYRGAGFMTPIQVLRNNMGDCDSKATLMAAILKTAKPQLNVAIVYIPAHAFIAIHWPVSGTQQSVLINKQKWLAVDPTGPALYQPGQISKQSRHYIDTGYYNDLIVGAK
ncbi:MAG: hypothetical protein CENE_01985 [Candidatus Celerinatantimonas neptuna]|nr:MAG: hypothetical protein CENE_01985 [Candidatus Celerinatantimonas neptuna]